MKRALIILFAFASVLSSFTVAEVRLPAIISDNMVLQQQSEVAIWGFADAGEQITVEADWHTGLPLVGRFLSPKPIAATTADEQGNWKVFLQTPKAGGNYTIKVSGTNEIVIQNVLIGELWLCGGQSNMSMPMEGWNKQPIEGGEEDLANSANDNIRLFKIPETSSDTPQTDVKAKWVVCNPENLKTFSAVGYYFGRKINNETSLPVGLISSNWGGTLAEAWTRKEFLATNDELSRLIDSYDEKYEKWQLDAEKAKAEGSAAPAAPQHRHKPAALYNGMIAPITDMTIKGTIWYQGEGNQGRAYQYRTLLPTMIDNWRCDFNNPKMPFYIVQLTSFTAHKPGEDVEVYSGDPREHGWAELREAQLLTSKHKYNGLAVTIDIGEANNIHPSNKKDVGERLALWALAKDYGKNIAYSGPIYSGYYIEGDKIRIKFDYADSGLIADGGKPVGFAIAGSDRKFVWADAEIQGSDIIVSSDLVANPVAVRYAWDVNPKCNIFNGVGLPASPFRTDQWFGATHGKYEY